MELRTHVWNELRSPEIAKVREDGAVVLLPVGSTEQHGAHLPLDTDIFSALSVSLRAAELVKTPHALVTKVLHVGFSPHHMAHSGTLSVKLETFLAVLRDVVTSISHHGFEKILIVNGHGGNVAPLVSIGNQLTTDGYPVAVCSYWDFIRKDLEETLDGERKVVGHACEFETSLLLHLRGEAVDMKRAVKDLRAPWNPDLEHDVLVDSGVTFPPVFRKESSGLLGDPTLATRIKGKELFEAAASRLAEFAKLFYDTDLGQ